MSMRKENKSDMAMLDLFKSFKTNAENIKLQTLQNCGTIKQKICKLCGASRFVAGVYMHCQSWSTPESSRNLLINYCSRDENTIRLIKVTGGRGRGGVGELSWTGTGSGTHWEWLETAGGMQTPIYCRAKQKASLSRSVELTGHCINLFIVAWNQKPSIDCCPALAIPTTVPMAMPHTGKKEGKKHMHVGLTR